MDRLDFIKQTLLGAGIGALPKRWIKQYQKYYLLQCFVRGFQYYNGPQLLNEMKVGDMLVLVREPENQYDPNAIALHFNKQKIGFIPAEENKMLSKLIDIKALDFQAEITHLEPQAATWENVSVALFVLKEKTTELNNLHLTALTTLESPTYYTLKHANNIVTRFNLIENNLDYYSFLVEYSLNDSIYDMIHTRLSESEEYGNGERIFVVKREYLNADQAISETIESIEHWMEKAEVHFEEEGLVALKMEDAALLIPKIIDLGEAYTKAGETFVELIL